MGHRSEILHPTYFTIGDNFFTGPYGMFGINKNNPVTIGNNVMFGPRCMIIGRNHDYTFKENHMIFNKQIDHMVSKIIIEDGVWVGANSVIVSSAYISEGAVIGAISLVNSYIPSYCVAVGIPAKKFKRRFANPDDLKELLANVNSKYSLQSLNDIYCKYKFNYY